MLSILEAVKIICISFLSLPLDESKQIEQKLPSPMGQKSGKGYPTDVTGYCRVDSKVVVSATGDEEPLIDMWNIVAVVVEQAAKRLPPRGTAWTTKGKLLSETFSHVIFTT
jgi:hypothetical protein